MAKIVYCDKILMHQTYRHLDQMSLEVMRDNLTSDVNVQQT